jgi:DNA topoisomerase-1
MQSAELDQTTVELVEKTGRTKLRATGSVIAFDGFLRLYREDTDDAGQDDDETRILPPMREGEPARRHEVTATQHFTQPPPRYSEASLVKKLEELGIGRPSTYASILQVLQDREYVRLDKRRFIPEDRGRLVTAFLVAFFERYVDTGFTAGLEEQLDDISGGRADWRAVMRAFWREFRAAVDATADLKISDVIDRLDEELGPHFFPRQADGADPRVCPACGTGRLGLRLGRTGAFIGCSNYPECRHTRPLAVPGAEGEGGGLEGGLRVLGVDPATGQQVTLRRGPYGIYAQLGEPGTDEKGKPTKPRRASLTRGMDPETMTIETALVLLSMPRVVGLHPETGEEITSNLGRFGPYLKMGALSKSLDRDDDPLTIGLNRAVALMADAKPRGITLGEHPKGGPVEVRRGRFGPFLLHGTRVANLPRGTEMEAVTLEEAVTLLAEKGKELPPQGKGKAGAKGRKAPAKRVAAGAAVTAAPERSAKPPARKPAAPKAKPASAKKPATAKAAAKKPATRKPAAKAKR